MGTVEIAKKIYDGLASQKFADWYSGNGDFGDHIMDDDNCKSKDEILADIIRIFHLRKK